MKNCIRNHYFVAFFVSLVVSIGLLVTSFFMPPKGEISPSVLQATALILVYPALAFAAKALDDDKQVRIKTEHATVTVGKVGEYDDENEVLHDIGTDTVEHGSAPRNIQ